MTLEAHRALNMLALQAQPSTEIMNLVRTIRAAINKTEGLPNFDGYEPIYYDPSSDTFQGDDAESHYVKWVRDDGSCQGDPKRNGCEHCEPEHGCKPPQSSCAGEKLDMEDHRKIIEALILREWTLNAKQEGATFGSVANATSQAIVDYIVDLTPPQWNDIATAPRDGIWCLYWDARYEKTRIARRGQGDMPQEGDWEYELQATHWMPLPSPPLAAKEGV